MNALLTAIVTISMLVPGPAGKKEYSAGGPAEVAKARILFIEGFV